MSLEKRGGTTARGYGFYKLPKTIKEWNYIHTILSNEEISNTPEDELMLCAYSNRVASGKKNNLLRIKYNKGYNHIDFKHYAFNQEKRWIPLEEWGAGEEHISLSEYILKHSIYSDSWRVFYAHKYPEKVSAKYSHNGLVNKLPELLEKEIIYNEHLAA